MSSSFEMELSGRVASGTSWDKAKFIFHEKLKADEGGDLSAVQQFLSDNSTVKQALESCELAKKKAEGKYSGRMARILKKVQMFVRFGDIAIQHHPDTTALVWAAFRMMLQVAILDLETCEMLTEACEDIAGTLFMGEVYERWYVKVIGEDDHDIAQKVVNGIPSLYATILEFSFYVRKHLSRDKFSRFLKSGENITLSRILSDIKKKAADLRDLAGMAFQQDVITSLHGFQNETKESFEELRQLMAAGTEGMHLSPLIGDIAITLTIAAIEETRRLNQESRTEQKSRADQKKLEMDIGKNYKWLDALEDPFEEHRLNRELRQPNTCIWIFSNEEYMDWYQSEASRMLWVVGNAGFGKSVLMSSVIDELGKVAGGAVVLFFYCKTGDDSTQRAGAVLRNIIAQLYEKTQSLWPELLEGSTKLLNKAREKAFGKESNLGKSEGNLGKNEMEFEYAKSVRYLKQILEDFSRLLGRQVFIIVDALDECNDRRSEKLVSSLRGLVEENTSIKILVASRPEADLEEDLEGIPKIEVGQNNNNSEDIKAYLIEELKKLSSCRPKERAIARREIMKRSAGMFRYANLAIDRLRQPWRRPIEKHLATFPDGLEAFYRQRFQEIKPELREVLVMTLRWTILARGDVTPLLVAEDYTRVFDDLESDGDDDSGDGEDTGSEDGADVDDDENEDEGSEDHGSENEVEAAEEGEGSIATANVESSSDLASDDGAPDEHTVDGETSDEYQGMLDDTLQHVKEAGSVFVESAARDSPLRLRHSSVKDFVLREGERSILARRETFCTPARRETFGTPARKETFGTPARKETFGTPARKEPFGTPALGETLCPHCARIEEATAPLSVTPKHGHLVLSLTIFNHLNSKAFKKRYLPVDETGSGEATDQTNAGDEGIDVNGEGNSGDASEVKADGEADEGLESDLEDAEKSEGEESGNLTVTGNEGAADDLEKESLPSGNVVGSQFQDEEGTSGHRFALPPRGDSGIDVTSPGEDDSAKLDVNQATIRRDGPTHRGQPTIFWSASEDTEYDFEFFNGPNSEVLRKLAVFVDSPSNQPTVKGIRFKRHGLGWGRYLGTGESGEANVAVFELQGEVIEGAYFQRRDVEGGGLVALSFQTGTRSTPYYGWDPTAAEHVVIRKLQQDPVGVCWGKSANAYPQIGLLYEITEEPEEFVYPAPDSPCPLKVPFADYKPTLDDAEGGRDNTSECDSDYNIDRGGAQDEGDGSETRSRYELTNWMYHLKEAERLWMPEERETDEDWIQLWELVEKFLCETEAEFRLWQQSVWATEYPYFFDDRSIGQAIHVAASYGLTGLVERLLKKGADVNSVNEDKVTPLHLAALSQDQGLVQLLLEHGADVNAEDCNKNTPLAKVACKLNGSPEIAELLLSKDAIVETADWEGITPLHGACEGGNLSIFRLLMKHGANPKARDKIGETPLHKALRHANPPVEIVEELIKHGADINEQDEYSQAPLYEAASLGSAAVVAILLEAGADINDDDLWGTTALHAAAAGGHRDAVKLLAESGANLTAVDKQGKTPLALAARGGRVEVVRLLLEKLAEVDPEKSYLAASDIRGRTALHRAAAKGHAEVVTMLLDAGEPSSERSQIEGNSLAATPLHPAAWAGHAKVVDILMKRGGDVYAKNRTGQTPLDLALSNLAEGYQWPEARAECLLAMVKNSPKAARSKTLLRSAIYMNAINVVTQILDQGMDPEEPDEHGWVPMALAIQLDRPEIVELLKSRGAKPLELPVQGDGGTPIGNAPTRLDEVGKGSILSVSEDGTEIRPLDPEMKYSRGAIRANHPIPAGKYIYYYEIECLGATPFDEAPVAGLGVCAEWAVLERYMPGWWSGVEAYGYHGDDGKLFAWSNPNPSVYYSFDGNYGPTYGPGDVIGCGVDLTNRTLFFTKNGEFLGYAASNVSGILYPILGLSEDSELRVNFGQDKNRPFRYTVPSSMEPPDPSQVTFQH